MNHFYNETRRDRWGRLPYTLIFMLLLAGGISYFFEDKPALTEVSPTETRAAEYIQERIAAHQQNPVTPPKVEAAPPTESFLKKVTPSAQLDYLRRIQLPSQLQFLAQWRREWLFASIAFPLLGMSMVRWRRRTRQTRQAKPAEKLFVARNPIKASDGPKESDKEEALFSLYLGNEKTSDEGTLLETYLMPTLANCGYALRRACRKLTLRGEREIYDPLHQLIPATPYAVPSDNPPASNGMFRRASITRP